MTESERENLRREATDPRNLARENRLKRQGLEAAIARGDEVAGRPRATVDRIADHDYIFAPYARCATCEELRALHHLVAAAEIAAYDDPPQNSKSAADAMTRVLWSRGVRAVKWETYTAPMHCFGCCPECRDEHRPEMGGEALTLDGEQYIVCSRHGVAWGIGWILTPEDGYKARAPHYRALLSSYRMLEYPGCPHVQEECYPVALPKKVTDELPF